MGFAGVNVTFPYKEKVISLLDRVSPQAKEIGAVNTVVVGADGKLTGHNTDRIGFKRGFEDALGVETARGQSALLIGAGGAGKAVAWALVDLGVRHLHIHDRDAVRASDLAAEVNRIADHEICHFAKDPADVAGTVAGIVNATPIGMIGYPGMSVPEALISRNHWIADVVYTPLETQLLKTARAKGCQTATGAGMCVHQAAEAFQLFTGMPADVRRMERLFHELVTKRDAAMLAQGAA